VFWKRAGASESSVSVADTGDHQVATIYAFRGCISSGNPVDTWGQATSSTNLVDSNYNWLGSITSFVNDASGATLSTSVDDCAVLNIVAHGVDSNTTTIRFGTATHLTGYAEQAGEIATNAGTGGGLSMAFGVKSAAGTVLSISGSNNMSGGPNTAAKAGMYVIALKPER
jgi:hypothetical protein